MSGVEIVRTLLAGATAVTNVVPATRIMSGPLPLKTPAPALAVGQVSGVERQTASMTEAVRLRDDRVQVTVYATNYPQQKAILELVRTACRNRSGPVAGLSLDSILPAGIGPDGFDPDPQVYEQTIDFIVRWKSA